MTAINPFAGAIAMMAGPHKTPSDGSRDYPLTTTFPGADAGIVLESYFVEVLSTVTAAAGPLPGYQIDFNLIEATAGAPNFQRIEGRHLLVQFKTPADFYTSEEHSTRAEAFRDHWLTPNPGSMRAHHVLRGWSNPRDDIEERNSIQNVLLKIQSAANAGNIRLAYREAFPFLDRLFLNGRWELVGDVLRTLCSDKFPVTVGLGAVRFSSSAKLRIQGWSSLVRVLRNRVTDENIDPDVLRGL